MLQAVRIAAPDHGPWRAPVLVDEPDAERELVQAALRRLRAIPGPYRIREQGGKLGPRLKKPASAAERFAHQLLVGPVGLVLFAVNEDGKGARGRVVDVMPRPSDTIGSPGVDRVAGLLFALFPGEWENWGIYNFRKIAGSSEWSDHAYTNRPAWCGRAIDAHPVEHGQLSMAVGDRIAAAIRAELASHLRYVLWRVAGHFDHVHTSCNDAGSPVPC